MNHKFDELTKGMAQSVTRRAALKKFGAGLAGIALALSLVLPVAAANPTQVAVLTASDGATGDGFGGSVSLSGDAVVVGASGNNSSTGAAYVFGRNVGGPENWGQLKKLTASDASSSFGFSVSISGDTLVVNSVGKVYVFERNAGGANNWGEVKKLTADCITVFLSGDTLVVGNNAENSFTGAAFVFERNKDGAENWGFVKKITASDPAAGDQFGIAVSLSGDTLVVGAWAKDSRTGAAYVFERNAGGAENWDQIAKLTAADGAPLDVFGSSVSIDVDRLVVGASNNNRPGPGEGYVFERNAGGAENWGQVKKLTYDGKPFNEFGNNSSISGDTVVVSAHFQDAVYVFERCAGGAENWGQVAKLPEGNSVSINLGTLVVGDSSGAGAAFVYNVTPNHPPIARCQNVTKSADADCQATVTAAEVDNGSSDPDGDPITLSLSPAGPYPLGKTTVTLTVADNRCGAVSCTATLTVVDTQAPTVACSVSQTILSNPWPPRHDLVNVGLSATTTDNCSGASLPVTVSVFGDEDDQETTGDGAFSPDAANIASGTLRLRQERKGDANGRVYLIVATAVDSSGNVGVNCCTVVVPQTLARADVASVSAQAAAAKAYCLSHNGAKPPGYFVIGDGPVTGPKQ